MKWLRWGGALLVFVAMLAAAWRLTVRDGPTAAEYRIPGIRAPYTLEVLNGTDVDGLALTITLRLRRAGLDVVSFGTASAGADSTTLLVRSSDTAAGWAVRDALGFGRVVVEPDARLLLDVTVLLGRDAATSIAER